MASLDERKVVTGLSSRRTLVDYHRIVLSVKYGKYIPVEATHMVPIRVCVASTFFIFTVLAAISQGICKVG